ncbi:MAG TPA: hypothetical protein ENJ09_09400 [Planctomycetes bacterium]|nr:hypothetical protein [Planctomycetota bacterium]
MASSILLGSPSDRLPLRAAGEALLQAVRRARRPGLGWLAGALYPGLYLNLVLVHALLGLVERTTGIVLPGAGDPKLLITLFAPQYLVHLLPDESPFLLVVVLALLLPLLVALARLVVGLAKVLDPELWRRRGAAPPYVVEAGIVPEARAVEPFPLLGPAWRAGRGLGAASLGLWSMLVVLLLGAGFVLIGPAVMLLRLTGLESASALLAGLLVAPLAVLFLYAAVLMVVNQLALHSLAHNQRGVASAITHAWRLARGAPRSTLRVTLLDIALSLAVLGTEALLVVGLGSLPSLRVALLVALYGFAGVTRAGLWARAYRALGGLSAADAVPGL